jgi:hypothetical protein
VAPRGRHFRSGKHYFASGFRAIVPVTRGRLAGARLAKARVSSIPVFGVGDGGLRCRRTRLAPHGPGRNCTGPLDASPTAPPAIPACRLLPAMWLRPARHAGPLPGVRGGANTRQGEGMRLRRFFTCASVLSLSLCVATCALWVRSHWVADDVQTESATTLYDLTSSLGRVQFYHATLPPRWFARKTLWRRIAPPFDATGCIPFPAPGVRAHFSKAGFGFYLTDGDTAPATNPFSFSTQYYPDWNLGLPHWFLAAAFMLLPMIHQLTRRRRIPGHCPACGYDLRATPDRCPECGAVSTAPK